MQQENAAALDALEVQPKAAGRHGLGHDAGQDVCIAGGPSDAHMAGAADGSA